MYIIVCLLGIISLLFSGCEIENVGDYVMFKETEHITVKDENTFPREIEVKYYVKQDSFIDGKNNLFVLRFKKPARGYDEYETFPLKKTAIDFFEYDVFPVKKEKEGYEIIGEEKLKGYVFKNVEEMNFRQPLSFEEKNGTIKIYFTSYKQYKNFLSSYNSGWKRVDEYYKKHK